MNADTHPDPNAARPTTADAARNTPTTEALPVGVDAATFKLAFAAALAVVRRNQSALRENRRTRDERLASRSAVQAAMDAVTNAPATSEAPATVTATAPAAPAASAVRKSTAHSRSTCPTCGAARAARSTMCVECYSPQVSIWPRAQEMDLPVPELVVDEPAQLDQPEEREHRSAVARLKARRVGKGRRAPRRGIAGALASAVERAKGHAVSIAIHGVMILAIWSLVVAARELQPDEELGIPVSVEFPSRAAQPTPMLDRSESAADAPAHVSPEPAAALPTESASIEPTLDQPQPTTTGLRSGAPARTTARADAVERPYTDSLAPNAAGQSLHGNGGDAGLGVVGEPVELFGKGVPGRRIVFALDRSGSMAANVRRSDARQASAWNVLVRELYVALDHIAARYEWAQGLGRDMNYQDYAFDIVCYDSEATVFRGDLVPPSRDNVAAAKLWVRQHYPRGGTDWNEALEAAHAYRDLDTIFFFSDGYPNDQAWAGLAKDARDACHDSFVFLGVQFGNGKKLTPLFAQLIDAHQPNARGHVVTGKDAGGKRVPARQQDLALSMDAAETSSGSN